MKFLATVPVILFFLLFTSATPKTPYKNRSTPTSKPCACGYVFEVDNSSGARTINHIKIEWPGSSFEYFPTIGPGADIGFNAFDPVNPMKYPVKVTLWWGPSPAVGPRLSLVTRQTSVTVGNFSSPAFSNVSTAVVNGTNANGPGASYCQGVVVFVTESI